MDGGIPTARRPGQEREWPENGMFEKEIRLKQLVRKTRFSVWPWEWLVKMEGKKGSLVGKCQGQGGKASDVSSTRMRKSLRTRGAVTGPSPYPGEPRGQDWASHCHCKSQRGTLPAGSSEERDLGRKRDRDRE